MPFKRVPQKFTSVINPVTIGIGASAVTLGGENVLPLYFFDSAIENTPKIGVELSDLGLNTALPELKKYYAGASTIAKLAARACAMPGADFLCLVLDSADPNGKDASVESCVSLCESVYEVIDKPLCIMGCGNVDKDARLLEKLSEAMQGKNVLLMSAREENYKGIAVSAGIAYGNKFAAQSSVDLNLAKQLNVLISQLGVSCDNFVMDLGSAAAGYGFEYIASTLERVKLAALQQNDQMLQMPIITPVSRESWTVKEALASESDFPEWGSCEQRGVDMEITTAAAAIAAGANAVILMHPDSVITISLMISELLRKDEV